MAVFVMVPCDGYHLTVVCFRGSLGVHYTRFRPFAVCSFVIV